MYDFNHLDYNKLQSFIDKVFRADRQISLDQDEITLAKMLLFTRTKDFRFGYIGSKNITVGIEHVIDSVLHKK